MSSNRVVVVTGASTGIGRATALRLDREGFRVFAGVRREADAESLRKEGSPRLEALLLDVTDPGAIEAAAKRVDVEVGDAGLGGLVNNAGIGIGAPIEFLDLDELRRQLDVNVVEAGGAVHMEDQRDDLLDLGAQLVGLAEDVRVVLGEAPHPEQAVQDAG